MKQSIFIEVQSEYSLDSLQLIKAAITHWLSHGTVAQQVLDHFEHLVASLDTMYLRKYDMSLQYVDYVTASFSQT